METLEQKLWEDRVLVMQIVTIVHLVMKVLVHFQVAVEHCEK